MPTRDAAAPAKSCLYIDRRTIDTGDFSTDPDSTSVRNSGDSSSFHRMYKAINNSGNAARNGRRHPHVLNDSPGRAVTARNAPDDSSVPSGDPINGIAV